MPLKKNNPGCNCCSTCVCPGKLYVTISGVAMNFAAPDCWDGMTLTPGPDQTWYNGVTFVFDPEWLNTSDVAAAGNPNGWNYYPGFSIEQCLVAGGGWQCDDGSGGFFRWTIGAAYYQSGGLFRVDVSLSCSLLVGSSETLISRQQVRYEWDAACPGGSYSEITRDFPSVNQNNGSFDFRNFNAALVWV